MNELGPIAALGVWAIITLAVVVSEIATKTAKIPRRVMGRSHRIAGRTGFIAPIDDSPIVVAKPDDTGASVRRSFRRLWGLREYLATLSYPPTAEQIAGTVRRHPEYSAEEVAMSGDLVYPTLTDPDRTPKRQVVVGMSAAKTLVMATVTEDTNVISAIPTKLVIDAESGASIRRQSLVSLRVMRGLGLVPGLSDESNRRAPRNIPVADKSGESYLTRIPMVGSIAYSTLAAQIAAMLDVAGDNVSESQPLDYLIGRVRAMLADPLTCIEDTDAARIIDSFESRAARESDESADTRKRAHAQYDQASIQALRVVQKAVAGAGKAVYVGRPSRAKIDYGTSVPNSETGWLDGRFARVMVGTFRHSRVTWIAVPDETRGTDLRPVIREVDVPMFATADTLHGTDSRDPTGTPRFAPHTKAAIEWRRAKVRQAITDRINGYGIDASLPDSAGVIAESRCGRCRERGATTKHLKECGNRVTVAAPVKVYGSDYGRMVMWQPCIVPTASPSGNATPLVAEVTPRPNPTVLSDRPPEPFPPEYRCRCYSDVRYRVRMAGRMGHRGRCSFWRGRPMEETGNDYESVHDVSDNDARLTGAGWL